MIKGLFTTAGISAAITADADEGFKIHVDSFGVSNVAGVLNGAIVPNAGLWFTAPVTSRTRIDGRTVKVSCTVPMGAVLVNKDINEVYLYGKDPFDVLYLLAAGQPDVTIQYTPSNSTTFELQLSLVDIDLTQNMVFNNTFPSELAQHNTDPNAHPDIPEALRKAGIFIPAGPYTFAYSGQNFDEYVEFDGAKASVNHGGTTFTAVKRGDEINGAALVFDGIMTVNEVVAAFNNAHPINLIVANGTGLEVRSAGTVNFSGGSYVVQEKDLVYKAADGLYKQALADGSIKSKVVGLAYRGEQLVRASGFFTKTTGFAVGADLFLSASVPGAITDIAGLVKVGVQIAATQLLIGISAGTTSGSSGGYDAIVSDVPSFNSFSTTQAAVDSVSTGSRILVNKIDFFSSTLNLGSKAIEFVFNGPATGWRRFLGSQLEFRLDFSLVPTSGTWRIEWNAQESADLAWNANAAAVQAAFNLFTGHSGATVTGDYTIGFTVQFADLAVLPLPTFLNAGANSIQRFNISDVPDNGTMRFEYDGNDTVNYAWNDSTLDLENDFAAVPGMTHVQVTGGFNNSYLQIEAKNQDGLQPKNNITVVANSLTKVGSPLTVNGVVAVFPIAPVIVQVGKYPASNLYNGASHIVIAIVPLIAGSPIGASTAVTVGANHTVFHGQGLIADFPTAFDLNGKTGVTLDLIFQNCTQPVLPGALVNKIDYNLDASFGIDRERVLVVGTQGEFATLALAYSAADTGDRIVVLEDQVLSSALVINKNIRIDFSNESRLLVNTYFAGNVVQLFDNVKTRDMHIVLSGAGTYDQVVSLQGASGHHKNLQVELSGATVIATQIFVMELNCSSTFVDGVIKRGVGTTSNVLLNSSGYYNHNVVIRDVENAINHTLFFGGPAGGQSVPIFKQVPLTGSGANWVLPTAPSDNDSVIIFKDGLPQFKTEYTLVGLNLTLNVAAVGSEAITAFYISQSPSPLAGRQEQPVGAVNGTNGTDGNDTFNVSGLPVANESVIVWKGAEYSPPNEWTLLSTQGSSKIKFNPGFVPVTGEDVYCFYFINIPNPASGGGGFVVTGLPASPVVIDPSIAISSMARPFQQQFVKGQVGMGAVAMTANPQVSPGKRVGDVLKLKGVHATDYPILNNGNGIRMNGFMELSEGSTWAASWDGNVWSEDSWVDGV